jgi:hypothetical protein
VAALSPLIIHDARSSDGSSEAGGKMVVVHRITLGGAFH